MSANWNQTEIFSLCEVVCGGCGGRAVTRAKMEVRWPRQRPIPEDLRAMSVPLAMGQESMDSHEGPGVPSLRIDKPEGWVVRPTALRTFEWRCNKKGCVS